MSAELVARCIENPGLGKNLQMNLIMQSAPVLKDVRMSCMVTVPAEYSRMTCSSLYNTGVRLHCLCRGREREVLLLYREKYLESYLEREDVADFLRAYGYENGSLKRKLQRLGEQIAYYYDKSQEFPHKMGVFLGYPLEDVRGFIDHQGKNSSCIGYWKVYSNVERAKHIFRVFDEARECAMNEFFSGKSIREIAC